MLKHSRAKVSKDESAVKCKGCCISLVVGVDFFPCAWRGMV